MANFYEVLYIFKPFHSRSQCLLRRGKYLAYSSTIDEFSDAKMIVGADSHVVANNKESGISGGGILYVGKNA